MATGEVQCNNEDKPEPLSEEEEERLHFAKIVNAYRHYKDHAINVLNKKRKYMARMSDDQQRRLIPYRNSLNDIQDLIETNAKILRLMVQNAASIFLNQPRDTNSTNQYRKKTTPTELDMDKTRSVMKQIFREWSSDGAAEREQNFGRILEEIDRRFGSLSDDQKRATQILVPGSGLGRLAFELANRGYATQGNEYSVFMLLASNFILNQCSEINKHTIYPFIHTVNNNLSVESQCKAIRFPDVDPSSIQAKDAPFSMAAGNFAEIYSEPDQWDAVVTCFFIDTGNNILAYLDTIWKCLKPGGVWINFGPLLYHFSDILGENSIEPSYDMLREMILSYGFAIEKEELNLLCRYTQHPDSMLQYEYRCVFFVCVKPMVTSDS